AGNAQTHAAEGGSARLWNLIAAVGAVSQRRPVRQSALYPLDAVLYGRIDLILHRTVARPTRRHATAPVRRPIAGCQATLYAQRLQGREVRGEERFTALEDEIS